MLTIPLQCFLNDKNIFHINFTRSLTFQWKLLVMAKHGELFASKILVCVQPLITRLCPLHVHKHGFIEHNRFITISSLRHIVTTNFAATIYHLLCEILLQRSLTRTISRREIAKIVSISRKANDISPRYIVAAKFVVTMCRSELRFNNLS